MAPTMTGLALGATLGTVALIGAVDAKPFSWGKKHGDNKKHKWDVNVEVNVNRDGSHSWTKATTKGKDWLWRDPKWAQSYDYDYDYSYDYDYQYGDHPFDYSVDFSSVDSMTPTPTMTPSETPTPTATDADWNVETTTPSMSYTPTTTDGDWNMETTTPSVSNTPTPTATNYDNEDEDDDHFDGDGDDDWDSNDDDDMTRNGDDDDDHHHHHDDDHDDDSHSYESYGSYESSYESGYWMSYKNGRSEWVDTYTYTYDVDTYTYESFWPTPTQWTYSNYEETSETTGVWSWFESIFGFAESAPAPVPHWEVDSYDTLEGDLLGGLLEELFLMTEDMSYWAATPGFGTSYDWTYDQSPAVDSYDWWSENEWWFEEEEMEVEDEMSAWLDTLINEAEALAMEFRAMWGDSYEPFYDAETDHGCMCLPDWQYNSETFNGCHDADNSGFAWCYVDGESCQGATEGAHAGTFSHWDKCFTDHAMAPHATAPAAPWIEWVEEDVAWMHDRHEGHHHDHGCDHRDRVPFGAFGAFLPWLDFGNLTYADTYAELYATEMMSAPAVISVDIGGVHGLNHSNLTGAFSSCISRQSQTDIGNGFGGLFSSLIGGIFNSSTEGLFDIGPTHLADAMGAVDLECVLYGFVNGTGSQGHGFGGGKRGVGKGKHTNLPAVHAPQPCTPEQQATHRPHCALEGEVVEVLGSWGVAVPTEAANVAVTMETGTTQTVAVIDPVTGHTFTVDITVSATAAEDTELDTKIVSSTGAGGANLDENVHTTTFGDDIDTAEDNFEAMYWRLRTKHAESADDDDGDMKDLEDIAIYAGLGSVIAFLIGGIAFWRRRANKNAEAARVVSGLVGVMPPDAKGGGGGQRVVIAMPATAVDSAQMAEKAVVEALPALEC